jgi:hypothetical protein
VPEGHQDPGDALAETEADLHRLVQRLRGLSPGAWRSRRTAVENLLAGLEKIAAELEGRRSRQVPALPDYARPDAVAVVGGDVIRELDQFRGAPSLSEVGGLIRCALDATR